MKAFIYTLFFGLFALFRVSYSFHTYHQTVFTIFYTILSVGLFSVMIYGAYRGAVLMNMSVRQIEIANERISLETFSSSMFLGLIKKKSFSVEIPRNLVEFEPTEKQYGFNKKWAGDIYHLIYAGDKYIIESGFFEDFSQLKKDLEAN